MSDIMHPVSFGELVVRILGEYRLHRSVFGIPEELFYKDDGKHTLEIFGRKCTTCLGPAAGPHTQLAQNIITSYLVGSRFLELKTCQEKDDFAATGAVAKPCIDAKDEGYNVEWSTEFTLPKAWDEYAKAYIILKMFEVLGGNRSRFIFNMSVGYTLDGIKTEKMQRYIDNMLDATRDPRWAEYLEELDAMLADKLFEGTPFEGKEKLFRDFTRNIDPHMVNNVTISTMHGCPPAEIEAICSYMLSEKNIHTYVKLNPTLLGYDSARKILDDNGFTYLTLKRESFEKDLQYADATKMLTRLIALGKKQNRQFGVKLTNTLGSVNDQGRLPGEEMYMSGRALLPLATTVASRLSEEFDGNLPISYCGGVTEFTAKDLFEAGLHPLTLATEMLHPGGYTRMKQIAETLEKSKGWGLEKVDVKKISAISEKARKGEFVPVTKEFRQSGDVKIHRPLPLTDCFVAPCTIACPIHQPIPEYVQLVGEKRYADALSLIYTSNPLPGITGHICDHQCQVRCTRNDYEGAVQIREMKRLALENGFEDFKKNWEKPDRSDVKAAVIGAGPAGLAASFFLARTGFDTTVFEREESAGGVVKHIIPSFRIDPEVVMGDFKFIEAHGVKFVWGVKPEEVTVARLKEKYDYIFYAVGAEKDNVMRIDSPAIHTSLDFLSAFNENKNALKPGKHVVVVGGGNTAMDSARAAKRLAGVEDVTVVYRRTEKEMPAAREELEYCLSEGIKVMFLSNPVALADGVATLDMMKLGEADVSGRRRPVSTGETTTIPCDYMITAIGEKADTEALKALGLPVNEKGWPLVDVRSKKVEGQPVYVIGDAQSGPSTVVRCIASARAASDNALETELEKREKCECTHDHDHENCTCGEHHDHDHENCTCGEHHDHEEMDVLTDEELDEIEALSEAEDNYFSLLAEKRSVVQTSLDPEDKDFAAREAARCMECSYVCEKCVDVCPNRANVIVDVRDCGLFDNPHQILHLDAYCNECGNCEMFCPYSGGPYKKKFTLFSTPAHLEDSENEGFAPVPGGIVVRYGGQVTELAFDKDGQLDAEVLPDEIAAVIGTVYESYSYLLGPVEE